MKTTQEASKQAKGQKRNRTGQFAPENRPAPGAALDKDDRDLRAEMALKRGTASVSRQVGRTQGTVARWLRHHPNKQTARPGAKPNLPDAGADSKGAAPSGLPRGDVTRSLLDTFRTDRDSNRPAAAAVDEWAQLNALKSLAINNRDKAVAAIDSEQYTDKDGVTWEMREGKPRDRFDEPGLRREWNKQATACGSREEIDALAATMWRKGGYTNTGIRDAGLKPTDYCTYTPGEMDVNPDKGVLEEHRSSYRDDMDSDFYFDSPDSAWVAAVAAEQARQEIDAEMNAVFEEIAQKGGFPEGSGEDVMAVDVNGELVSVGKMVNQGRSTGWDHDKLMDGLWEQSGGDLERYANSIEGVKKPNQWGLKGLSGMGLDGMTWKEDGRKSIRVAA